MENTRFIFHLKIHIPSGKASPQYGFAQQEHGEHESFVERTSGGGSSSVGALGTMDFSLMGRTNLAALLLAFLLAALRIVVSLVTLRYMGASFSHKALQL